MSCWKKPDCVQSGWKNWLSTPGRSTASRIRTATCIDNVSLLYRAHGVTGQVVPQPEKVLEWRWFAPDALLMLEELRGRLLVGMIRLAAGL